MKLIINCSTLVSTGPVQVAVSFLNECRVHDENQYLVFLSPKVKASIDIHDFPPFFQFVAIDNHPAYGLKSLHSLRLMRKYETSFKADCVFSIFGPSIWKPKTPHLQGFAYGYYIYTDSPIFKLMSLHDKIKRYLMRKAHLFHLKRDGKYFVCETEDVSNRLRLLLNINVKNVYTVTNTCSHYFTSFQEPTTRLLPKRESGEFRILLLSTAYPHKHIEILNDIISYLNKRKIGGNISFVVTIPQDDYNRLFNEEHRSRIYNVGVVKPEDCPRLYFETDALFAPTLLECFSANYPEAMAMKKPIVTTDLSFARSICGDAALYFSPLDAEDAALKIITIANQSNIREELIHNGHQRLSLFDNASQRAEKYLKICRQFLTEEKLNSSCR